MIYPNPMKSQEIWGPSSDHTSQHHENAHKILGNEHISQHNENAHKILGDLSLVQPKC